MSNFKGQGAQVQQLYLATRKAVHCIPVNMDEWNRLKDMIDEVDHVPGNEATMWPLCFGVSASALMSIIALAFVANPPNWTITAFWVIFFGSLTAGCSFFWHDTKTLEKRKNSKTRILKEMERVEAQFVVVEPVHGVPTLRSTVLGSSPSGGLDPS